MLTGTIPIGLMNLTNLTYFDVGGNRLVGTIPTQIGQLSRLAYVSLEDNDFTGTIPASFSDLTELIDVRMGYNRLSGTLPNLSRLTNLDALLLAENELEGPIPPEVGDLSKLTYLSLGQNKFSGAIPRELGRLSNLLFLGLDANALRGAVPDEILGLTSLQDGQSYFTYNALTTSNPAVDAFLTRKQSGNDWKSTQTVPPTNVRVSGQSANTVILTWDRVGSVFDPGGYQVVATTAGAQPAIQTTADKTLSAILVKDLSPLTSYSFVVHTVTYPNDFQKNLLVSDPSPPVSASTTANVPSGPLVVVTTFPFGLVQSDGEGEDRLEDYYVVSNFGDAATTITLTQENDFFTQDPPTLTLGPGEEAFISLIAVPRPAGAYAGASVLTGAGVPEGLKVPVHLLAVVTPTGTVIAEATSNRVDLFATEDVQVLSGSAQFHNNGNATLNGIMVSDVPWLIPQSGLITIPPAQSVEVTFQIDRTQRSDDDGTATGTLSLLYLQSSSTTTAHRRGSQTTSGRRGILNGSTTSVATATVTVVDTVKPPVAASDIPPLQPEEVALLIPGVGHLISGNGSRTLSDVSIANAFAVDLLRDLRMYFTSETPAIATSSANLEELPPSQGLLLGDVVKSVFNHDADSGTLQIRSLDWNKIAVSAHLINVAPTGGSYGTAIPVFRSDRATRPGERLVLTGLRKGPASRTDLIVQETSGQAAQVQVQYLGADGTVVGSSEESLQPFRMRRIVDRVPTGAVTARVINLPTSAGRIVAYATPIDTMTGDFWTVVDWDQQFAARRTEPRLIPVAGAVRGMNGSSFRTDLDIVNVGPERASLQMIYYREELHREGHHVGAGSDANLCECGRRFLQRTGLAGSHRDHAARLESHHHQPNLPERTNRHLRRGSSQHSPGRRAASGPDAGRWGRRNRVTKHDSGEESRHLSHQCRARRNGGLSAYGANDGVLCGRAGQSSRPTHDDEFRSASPRIAAGQ
jgi:fibronectin type III domain protein